MPRTKTDAERGYIGAWMRRQRTSRTDERTGKPWTVERVVEELAKRDYRVRADYYRGLEAGNQKPGPDLLGHLVDIYGSRPEPLPEPEPEPSDDPLAAAVRELVAEVRLNRLAQERSAEVLARLVGMVVAGSRPQSETEASIGAQAQRDTP